MKITSKPGDCAAATPVLYALMSHCVPKTKKNTFAAQLLPHDRLTSERADEAAHRTY
jgi:hypothetical protein